MRPTELKTLLHRTSLGMIAIAIATLTTVSHAQNIGSSMIDGACIYMKKNNIEVEAPDNELKGIFDKGKSALGDMFKDKSPLCQLNNPAAVLVVTGRYIDKATLEAARGLDSIEQAMGMKQSLTEVIVSLEKALAGEDFSQLDEEKVKASEIIGARAEAIEAELAKRDDKFLGSEEFEEHVVAAQVSLNAANYYQAQSAIGVAVFRDYWIDASDEERKGLMLANAEVGITSEFAEQLPQRGAAMIQNVVKATSLGSDINKTLGKKELKNAKREIKKAQQAEEKIAMKEAQEINEQTTSFAIAAAPAEAEPADTASKDEDDSSNPAAALGSLVDGDDESAKDCADDSGNPLKKARGLFNSLSGKDDKEKDSDC